MTSTTKTSFFKLFPAEYTRVQLTCYERQNFRLNDMRHIVHTIGVSNLSRPSNSKLIAGRGIAMQAAGYNGSDA